MTPDGAPSPDESAGSPESSRSEARRRGRPRGPEKVRMHAWVLRTTRSRFSFHASSLDMPLGEYLDQLAEGGGLAGPRPDCQEPGLGLP